MDLGREKLIQNDVAKNAALQYISFRLRTEKEVRDYLSEKEFDEDIIENVLIFLKQYDYINDEAYCKSWIHDKMMFHPCGRMKMELELIRKTGNQTVVKESLKTFFDEETEVSFALKAALQKLSGSKVYNAEQIVRFLYGRGYSASVSKRVLENESVSTRLKKTERKQRFIHDSFGDDYGE